MTDDNDNDRYLCMAARLENLEKSIDILAAVIATMAHTQETTSQRLTMQMDFIRRIAAQTGSTIAPSFAEALESNDVELIQAHLANFESELSH